jgi:hypothetical protein
LLVLFTCCAHRLTEPLYCAPVGWSHSLTGTIHGPFFLTSIFLPGKARVRRIGHERQGCISLTHCNFCDVNMSTQCKYDDTSSQGSSRWKRGELDEGVVRVMAGFACCNQSKMCPWSCGSVLDQEARKAHDNSSFVLQSDTYCGRYFGIRYGGYLAMNHHRFKVLETTRCSYPAGLGSVHTMYDCFNMELAVGPGALRPTLIFGPETSPLDHPALPSTAGSLSRDGTGQASRELGLDWRCCRRVGHATRQLDRLRRAGRQGLAHRCAGLGLAVWALGGQATRQADEAVPLAPIYLSGKQEANNCL